MKHFEIKIIQVGKKITLQSMYITTQRKVFAIIGICNRGATNLFIFSVRICDLKWLHFLKFSIFYINPLYKYVY